MAQPENEAAQKTSSERWSAPNRSARIRGSAGVRLSTTSVRAKASSLEPQAVSELSSEDNDSIHKDTALQSVGAAKESESTISKKMDTHTVDGTD